jgi:hypothetical protein
VSYMAGASAPEVAEALPLAAGHAINLRDS